MPLGQGSTIGPYELVARLGAGGMGEVWRARDPRLEREVAVKVLAEDAPRDAERVVRFQAEARAASRLNHPNIVTVHDVGQQDGRAWLSMELLDGPTLRQVLDGPRPPLRDALRMAAQIADGLAATHAKGIVHRDLKPENVIVTNGGIVKILDFGLAKTSPLSGGGVEKTLSTGSFGPSPGAFLGTIGYMSPEQASGDEVDFRSDQFSFGTILYELVTGRRAWKRATPAETVTAILREDAPAIALTDSNVPDAVSRIVERCLAKEPATRYGSTSDLARDVRYLADHLTDFQNAPQQRLLAPLSARGPRFLPTARAAGLWAVVLLAAAGGMAAWRAWRAGAGAVDSLAVLPFQNATRDPEDEYLSDGFTESLIDRMSRLPPLKVMARATVFRFKSVTNPQEAGRKMNVQAVVSGSVSRRGDRLAIVAEAIDVRTGARLWGGRYDRPFADLVRVQSEIASDISTGLELRLTGADKRLLGRRGTESTEAYDLFLKGRHASLKDTEEGYLEAIRLFLEAVEKDPRFAEAHLEAADTYGVMVSDGYVRPAEAWAHSDEGARKALALEPDLSDARAALAARLAFFDWNFTGAERDFRELFAGPRPPVGHIRAFALLLWARGKTDEAIALTEKARGLDPGNLVFPIATGDYLAQAGRYAEAIGFYRSAIEAEPTDPRAHFGLANIFRKRGEVGNAIESLRKAYELSGEDEGVKALTSARTEQDYDSAQLAVARARLADLNALARERYVSPLELARLQALLGDREGAFSNLEAAIAERSSGLVFLNVDKAWDRIRGDARFGSMVRRVGLAGPGGSR